MIDEKDIRKAATLTYNPALDAVANFSARNAFLAGVEWFKKALWHSQNEIPEDGRIILVKGWFNCKRSRDYYIVIDTAEVGTSLAEVASLVSWAEVLLLRALKELED